MLLNVIATVLYLNKLTGIVAKLVHPLNAFAKEVAATLYLKRSTGKVIKLESE
jgi:hypothetical protein